MVVGLVLFVAGVYDFSQSFGDHDKAPTRFWMCFLGVPLLGIGTMISKFAFIGTAARYVVGETKDSARDFVGAVAGGIRDGLDREEDGPPCPSCGEENDPDAKFCDKCGAALATSAACPSCGRENEADANFCDECGASLR
jgi:hypothetical protein